MYVQMDITAVIFWTWIVGIKGDIVANLGQFYINHDKLNFSEAGLYCGSIDARLLTLESQIKYEHFLAEDNEYNSDYTLSTILYIGLSTSSTDCTNYVWSSGLPLTWSKWDPLNNEPNRCSDYQCVKLHSRLFRTTPCKLERKSICENVQPEPTSASSSSTSSSSSLSSSTSSTMKITTPTTSTAATNGGKTTTNMESTLSLSSGLTAHSTSPHLSSTTTTAAATTTTTTTAATTKETNSVAVSTGATTSTTMASLSSLPVTRNITTTTTMTTVSTADPTTVNTSCGCCSRRQTNATQLSQTELLEVITQLKAELSVSKNNTSTHQRKLVSVYESRPSSMVMGGVACSIMSVVMGWIVVPDFIMLCLFLFKCVSKNVFTPSV